MILQNFARFPDEFGTIAAWYNCIYERKTIRDKWDSVALRFATQPIG